MDLFLTGILAFASTNLDDLFLLTLFFGNSNFKHWDISLGQYIGIGALIALSMVGASLGRWFDIRYLGLLGLYPIYLGVKQFIALARKEKTEESENLEEKTNWSTSFLAVASITIANGGDNIGIYIPLFARLRPGEQTTLIFIFLCMVAVWLIAAQYLSQRPILTKTISRYGHIITPVILCLLGLFILYENRSYTLLYY